MTENVENHDRQRSEVIRKIEENFEIMVTSSDFLSLPFIFSVSLWQCFEIKFLFVQKYTKGTERIF